MVAAWACACSFVSASEVERPNILVIMTDDLRIGMLGAEGHPYLKTPNLDRFVSEGVTFNNCYALSPVCGPSRASIFTGQYSTQHMRRDNFYYPDDFEYYLPQYFRDSGYVTALIGKYYEGDAFRKKARKAWSHWFVNAGPDTEKRTPGMSHIDWWNAYLYQDQMYAVGKDRKVVIEGHQTDILFDEAARFAVDTKEQPFCIFLSPFSPHTPLIPTKRNAGKYKGMGIPERPDLELDLGYFRKEGRLEEVINMYEEYCAMITDIDEGMGRLFQSLEQSGQLDNTLIIFTSDNGLLYGEHGFAWKRHPWESSAKVPFFVRYPKLAKGGSESDALVNLADIFFTCADLGRVKLPEIPGQQGESILPLLSGEVDQVRDEMMFIQYEKPDRENPGVPEVMLWASVVRANGWKLTEYNIPPEQRPDVPLTQMYHLATDAYEMENLAGNPEYAPALKSLKTQLKQKLEAIEADSTWMR
ncbi:sulfatase-like hydrolase/transferase [Coraliomargarita algicola]|uniref:Sulfatase-like hydrolase/transferase n=1 Tax=Coraliomargarita algicola TaxID=3092156 RepID=A0ABZ0RPS5_9BACT|nr:sulfatase-like hydrolase/transferase [Coraliomargarita sp. J2-16]WPJ98220.1 sulfatase-like hydrolase/transferase [Coraliomargarita sp. J2-16]